MSDQASTPTVLAPIAIPPEYALPFMQMGQREPRKFKTIDGGRRMLGDRTSGAASLKLVQKENSQ